MSSLVLESLSYAWIPAVTILIGGMLALIMRPSKKVTSFTQHFAAGVVFAAVALELLPKLTQLNHNWALVLGFCLGVGLMLLLREVTGRHGKNTNNQTLPWSMLTAIGIDLLIDGLLIGIAFVAGAKGGLLVAAALAIEIFFLGITVATSLSQRLISKTLILLILIFFACTVVMAAMIGSALIANTHDAVLEIILAFGVAALLYLVTEELLEKAHETNDTPWVTMAFFAGFLIIYLLNQQL